MSAPLARKDPTSTRRDPLVRSIWFGTACRLTAATSARRTRWPLGVSMGRSSMLVTLERVAGVLQTWTS
jgi:hypothetical protein